MTKNKTARIGPRMLDVQSFVEANPGRAMYHAAVYVGPNASARYGYATVHRAIDAGLVEAVPAETGNAVLLFPVTRGVQS
jgi:hypothetical protein